MTPIDLRHWFRALRLRTVAVALAWLLPTWLALTSWEWSRNAIVHMDDQAMKGTSLISVLSILFILSAAARKTMSRISAVSRSKRIASARYASAKARSERWRQLLAQCDDVELSILRASVELGVERLHPSDLMRQLNFTKQGEWTPLDAGLNRLMSRDFLMRWPHQGFGGGEETIRIEEQVFRVITEAPSLVKSTAPGKGFAK